MVVVTIHVRTLLEVLHVAMMKARCLMKVAQHLKVLEPLHSCSLVVYYIYVQEPRVGLCNIVRDHMILIVFVVDSLFLYICIMHD